MSQQRLVIRSELGCEWGGHIAQEVVTGSWPAAQRRSAAAAGSSKIWRVKHAGEKTALRLPLGRKVEAAYSSAPSGVPRTRRPWRSQRRAHLRSNWAFRVGRVGPRCWQVLHPRHSRCGSCAIELDARVFAEFSLAKVCFSSWIRSAAAITLIS